MIDDASVIYWAEELVDPKMSRREILQDLLDHSNTDKMTREDKVFCIRAIHLIETGTIKNEPAQAPLED